MNARLKIRLAMDDDGDKRFITISVRLPENCDTQDKVQDYIHTWRLANPALASVGCGFDWIRTVYL